MNLESLEIQNLRKIKRLHIEPSLDVNWIIGGNGAGKTSLLESVFLLARGRTFRGARHGTLIRQGEKRLKIVGRLEKEGVRSSIEMSILAGRKLLYENGKRIQRVRDLKERIQVRMIGENSQKLLEGDPAVRRKFLNWNLFHVEHGYCDLLFSLERVLSQRNAWLRNGGRGPRVWDDEYLHLAEKVTCVRRQFIESLCMELARLRDRFSSVPGVSVCLAPGWPLEASLADCLATSFREDLRRGYTRYGPARADMIVATEGLRTIGSRGQSKLLVCLLQYSARRVYCSRGFTNCIWLLDDLRAELDKIAFKEVWPLFCGDGGQLFVTGRDIDPRGELEFAFDRGRVFHVQEGALTASASLA